MKKMKLVLLSLAVIGFIMACNNCNNDDCPPPDTWSLFKIVGTSNNNLYQSPNQIFFEDSLKIFGVIESEQIDVQFGITNSQELWIQLNLSIQQYIIKYNSTAIDSLYFEYEIVEDDCCGSSLSDYNIKINESKLCVKCEGKLITIVK